MMPPEVRRFDVRAFWSSLRSCLTHQQCPFSVSVRVSLCYWCERTRLLIPMIKISCGVKKRCVRTMELCLQLLLLQQLLVHRKAKAKWLVRYCCGVVRCEVAAEGKQMRRRKNVW